MSNTNKLVSERFQAIIDYTGLSAAAFSKEIGFERADKIYNILNGKFNPSYDILLAITNKFVSINIDWLISGSGSMLKNIPLDNKDLEKEESPTDRIMSVYKLKTDYFNTDKQLIPLYEISGAAGLVTLFDNQHVQQIPLDFISIPNAPKCDGAVFVRGDSMYPVLKAGDIVCYKHIEKLDDIYWGEMYLLDIDVAGDQYLTFKYVQKSDKGDEYIRLVSQNSHHSPKDVKKEDIRAIALVKVSIRYNTLS